VQDWRKGKAHEGTLEDCQKVVCCLNYEAELRARAAAKYPDPGPEIAAKIEAKIQRLLAEYRAAQLPAPGEQKQPGFKRPQGQGRGLRL
jgi:hypothetical protein